MDTFLIAFETVLPLFLVIFAGTFFSQTKAASQYWVEILNKYALWIGFPALVIVSLLHLEGEIGVYLPLIWQNSVFVVVSMLLAYPISALFGFSKKMKRSLFLLLPFGNVSYLGIPVLANTLGDEILPIAAIISAVYVFWMLTLGLVLIEMEGKREINFKKLALSLGKNPLLISVIAGLVIVSFQITLPGFIEKTLRFFSDSVTAVVLFSLGIFLGMQKIGNPREWLRVAVFAVVSMVVLPALFWAALQFSGLPACQLKSSILDAAMPLGITPYALSVQYQLETKLFARVVVLGTLLSIVILPLWITVLG